MQATINTFQAIKPRTNKAAFMGSEWEEKQERSRKKGKIQRGKMRDNKRSQWEV